MVESFDIAVMGGDMRQVYIAQEFIKKGFRVAYLGLDHPSLDQSCSLAKDLNDLLANSKIIIGPIPFTKDRKNIHTMQAHENMEIHHLLSLLKPHHILIGGALPESVCEFCNINKISYHDLMKVDRVAMLNSVATAEGTIAEAILASPTNLHDSHCLVTGYGRCAKVLAEKLRGLHGQVTVAVRSDIAMASASSFGYKTQSLATLENCISQFDYIFNTVPAPILSAGLLIKTKPDVIIIDIASGPGGVDFTAAEKLKRAAKLCPGLPGKVSPKTSASILLEEIFMMIPSHDAH